MSGIEISHKLDMLIKDAYNVSRTDANAPWYEETQVKYTTYIDGKEILIDTLPYTPVFKDVSDVSLNIYDLSVNDFSDVFDISGSTEYHRSGIFQSVDGLLHKFVGLKLDTSGNGKSWTKLNNSNSILENSFQVNYGDGLSYVYRLFHPDKTKDELNQDSHNGNWYFDYKNGIVHLDPLQPGVSDLSNTNKPLFTFVKYAGRKGLDKFLSQGDVVPGKEHSVNKQIFIDTIENVIYRFNDPNGDKSGEWVSLGGGSIDIRGGDISANDPSLNDTTLGLGEKNRSEGEIIYDSSKNIFYEASRSKTDVSGNGDLAFRPLGYSFFRDNMEGQPPSPLFFFFELTPFSININWTNPTQYGSGVTNLKDSYNSVSGENSSTVNLEGNIYFPVVNRIMIQIKDLSDNSYKYWGNKYSPISKNIPGLVHGRVICSKNYPILPMKSGVTPPFGNFNPMDSSGNDTKIYKLKDFANAITLFSSDSTPTNDFLSESEYFMKINPKTIYPTKDDATRTEISKSKVGYEIKIWLENQYKSSTNNMTEADFNVITITTAKDNNNLDLGAINFQYAEPPSDASQNILKVAFNNLGIVSSADTVIELKIKDPDKTTNQTKHDIYGYYNLFLNLIQIEFQYANYDSDAPTSNDWKAVKKIYTSNTTTSLSIATPESLTNGVFSFNRPQDENYRYYYIKLNNDYLDVSNNEMKKNHKFRVRYKNSANDQFPSTWKDSNIISIQEPAKVDISSVKMTSYNKFTITIDDYSYDKVINPDAGNTYISNNDYAVFLRKIKFNVQYKLGNKSKLQVPSFDISGAEGTEADTSMNNVFITTNSSSHHTYDYTLPAGIYPTSGTEAITYYFQAQVANNVYKSESKQYSVLSDEKFIQIEKPSSLNNIVFSFPLNSNNKITATINSIVDASRGIISAQTTPGLPTISQYTFESSILKLLNNDNGVYHNNTTNQSTRDDDPLLVKTFTFYDALQGKSENDKVSLDLKVREYNEYINDFTQKNVSINAVISLPDIVSGLNTSNNVTSSAADISNNITLTWNHLADDKRGLTIGGNAIKNTIDTFTIDITRNSTNNKYLLANITNAGFIDTLYNVTTNNSNISNDKTGTTDAVNNIKIDSTMDDSLLWPDTSYNFIVTATNSLGYISNAQTAFPFSTPTVPKPFGYLYFNYDYIDDLLPTTTNKKNYKNVSNYTNFGVPERNLASTITAGYQITNINTLETTITSQTKTHLLNKKSLQLINNISDANVKTWVDNGVPNNAYQASFVIYDGTNVKYTIGADRNNYDVSSGDMTLFSINRSARVDVYGLASYDPNNKGYWFKEEVFYGIYPGTNGTNFRDYVGVGPHKFILKSFYDDTGSQTISSTKTGEVVILQNNHANNSNNIYFDDLNTRPSISGTNMIKYNIDISINGIPNLESGSDIEVTYVAGNYSKYFRLGSTNNVLAHTFIYSNSMEEEDSTAWTAITTANAVRNANDWTVTNKNIIIPSQTTAYSNIRIKITATNTYDSSNVEIGASQSAVYNFIHDKPSYTYYTDVSGSMRAVPVDFDPEGETTGTSLLTPDAYDPAINNVQMTLWNGGFYSNAGWKVASGISNGTSYGCDDAPVFSTTTTGYNWVIFEYTGNHPTGTATYQYWSVIGDFSTSTYTKSNVIAKDIVVYFYNQGDFFTDANYPNPLNWYWSKISENDVEYGADDASQDKIHTYKTFNPSKGTGFNGQLDNMDPPTSYSLWNTTGSRLLGGWTRKSAIAAGDSAKFYLAIKVRKNNTNIKIKKPVLVLKQSGTVSKTLS